MAVQEAEYCFQRKTVLLSERDHDPIVGRRSLQFKIKGQTEPLPQGEAPSTVDPASEWRMQDQLHPAAFIEKPFCNDRLLRRHDSKHRLARQHILDRLLRAPRIQATIVLEPAHG